MTVFDFAPFDLVLDTDNLNAEEVFEVLCRVIGNVVLPVPASN
jgi:cytidylate kinase